jgi:hypothetical protein
MKRRVAIGVILTACRAEIAEAFGRANSSQAPGMELTDEAH